MKQILNKLALSIFDIVAITKGYKFKKVETLQECCDINHFYDNESSASENGFKDKVKMYKVGKINFIAYHKGKAVGAVRLSDPWVASQGHEIFGFDEFGIVYEIQNLAIEHKSYIDSEFVMLGLFSAMYKFSVSHSILCWSANGLKNICKILNGYCQKNTTNEVDYKNFDHPLTDYSHTKKIKDTTFSVDVAAPPSPE